MVLAKRAVNAHKRHSEKVLILTYNITITNYIRDRISDVRENFNWSNFYINNYHNLITRLLNNLGVEIDFNNKEDVEKNYYSNINLFKENKDEIDKYKTIIIDEAQDYKSEWIEILKNYFLDENGELVLFGDEKQNIYDRELIGKKPNTRIAGRWNILNKPMRYNLWDGSQILPLLQNYQNEFFKDKYIIDDKTEKNTQLTLIDDKEQILFEIAHYKKSEYEEVAKI